MPNPDSFTGTDGTALPTYSSDWSLFASSAYNNCAIHTNAAGVTGAAFQGNRFSGRTWSNDQYAEATIVAVASSRQCVCVRMIDTTANTCYAGGIDPGFTGHNRYMIIKFVAGVRTALFTHGSQSAGVSDVVRLSVTGTTLLLTVNGTVINGAGTTDSGISSGQGGLVLANSVTGPFLDDWSGGDNDPQSTITGLRPAMRVPNILVF